MNQIKCWYQDPNVRPTFEEIEIWLRMDQDFITDKDDKDYIKYINYIDEKTRINTSKLIHENESNSSLSFNKLVGENDKAESLEFLFKKFTIKVHLF